MCRICHLSRPLALVGADARVSYFVAQSDRYAVQVDNRLVPQVLRAMEKKGSAYRTSQGRAKGVSRIAHHTMEEAETKELISNMIETSYFAVVSLPQFSGVEFGKCEVVLQIYSMTSAKEDVAARLWSIVYIQPPPVFVKVGLSLHCR